MKHNSGNRRSRSRGGKQRHGGGGRNNYDSNGPGGKVRGTAQQVLDKYLALARDAQSSGDRIGAESFFQFAEHYYRVLNADGANNNNQQNRRDRQAAAPADAATQPVEGSVADPAPADAESEPAAQEAESAASVDPADQPQPDIADMIPPAIEVAPAAGAEEEPAPKPRRRRRTKTETPAEETETAQAS